jgi:hypothetical protein
MVTAPNAVDPSISVFTVPRPRRLSPISLQPPNWNNWLPTAELKSQSQSYLRLSVYRQSLRRALRPLEAHDQIFFFNWTLAVIVLMLTTSPKRRWDCLLWICSQSQSYVTTDGQSASLSWCQAPIWDLKPDFFCLTVAGLLMWGALSDERTVLSFTMYNIFTFYMLLHECIYTIYARLLSVTPAQGYVHHAQWTR